MNYPIFKQRWVKTLPDGKVAEVYSIHLTPESAIEFIEQQRLQPTYPEYIATGHPVPDMVNEEIFNYLTTAKNWWTEEEH